MLLYMQPSFYDCGVRANFQPPQLIFAKIEFLIQHNVIMIIQIKNH